LQLPETKYVKFSNAKLSLTETRLSLRWVPATIEELATFHVFCKTATPADWKDGLPTQFHTLLAKLVQESSVTATELASDLLEILFPLHFEHNSAMLVEEAAVFSPTKPVPSHLLIKQISTVAKRENYGVSEDLSARMAIWRWEVQDLALLPAELSAMIEARRVRRAEAKKEAYMLVRGLSFGFFFLVRLVFSFSSVLFVLFVFFLTIAR